MVKKKSTSKKKVTAKKVSKKSTVKKATTKKKVVARKKTASKKKAVTRKTSIVISNEDRYKMVAEAAYHLSEQQGFQPGMDLDNWLMAELQIEAEIKKKKITVR